MGYVKKTNKSLAQTRHTLLQLHREPFRLVKMPAKKGNINSYTAIPNRYKSIENILTIFLSLNSAYQFDFLAVFHKILLGPFLNILFYA